MARAKGSEAQMALAFEATYGTKPAASKFWKIPFVSTTLGSEQPLLASNLLGYGRDPLAPVKDAITVDGDAVVPLDLRNLGLWLKLLFGAPTTTGSAAPYTHTFKSGASALPSATIEIGNPEVPSFRQNLGVMANQMQLNMQRTGLVDLTVGLVAQGEDTATATSAGTTPSQMALQRFGSFNGSISQGGAQLANVVSGSLTYSNNLDRVETIRSDGKIEGLDPSVAALTGEIVVRFADTTLLDKAISGEAVSLEFAYMIDAQNKFSITAHEVYLPKPKISVSGPGGVQVTFAWQAAKNTAAGCMATTALINDVANYTQPA